MSKKRLISLILMISLFIQVSMISYYKVDALDVKATDIETELNNGIPVKEWTFMVYLDGDNNLEANAIDDINEMEAAGGSTADVNIIVLVDLCGHETSANSEYGITWDDARYYYIEAGSDPDVIESTLISVEGEINMGRGDTLTSFIDFVTTNYPAKRYGLSLWDHGGGFEGICWDDDNNGDSIGINELQEALVGYHFDFLGMDACIMGQYEIVYEVSPYADYVGVSLLNEPGDGWDYENFLPFLLADPYMTGDILGEHICTTYVDQYSSDVTFGIWNTTDMTTVQTEIDDLATILMDNLDTYGSEIALARELAPSDDYPSYGSDIHEFVINLQSSTSVDIVNQAADVQAALEDINILSYSSFTVHPFGLLIYFPTIPNEDYNQFYANSDQQYVNYQSNPYYGFDFVMNSSWEDFIYAWRETLPDILSKIADGEELEITTGDNQYFAVDLVAGDRLYAELHSNSQEKINLEVYDPLGRIADSDYTIFNPKIAEYTTSENCSVFIGVLNEFGSPCDYNLSVMIDSRPYIADIGISPEEPIFGEDVEILCEIIDGHGLDEVILSYSTDGSWTDVAMTEVSEGWYSYTILIDESTQQIQYRIEATDNLDNTMISSTKVTYFHEGNAPELKSVKFDPKKPKSGEEVTLTVVVTDSSGIDKVILSYDFGEGKNNITINTNNLDEYVFTLNLPENGTAVTYQLYVFDTWGNCLVTGEVIKELDVGPLPISPLMSILAIGILALAYLRMSRRK